VLHVETEARRTGRLVQSQAKDARVPVFGSRHSFGTKVDPLWNSLTLE
jgi:hypothetical protein